MIHTVKIALPGHGQFMFYFHMLLERSHRSESAVAGGVGDHHLESPSAYKEKEFGELYFPVQLLVKPLRETLIPRRVTLPLIFHIP